MFFSSDLSWFKRPKIESVKKPKKGQILSHTLDKPHPCPRDGCSTPFLLGTSCLVSHDDNPLEDNWGFLDVENVRPFQAKTAHLTDETLVDTHHGPLYSEGSRSSAGPFALGHPFPPDEKEVSASAPLARTTRPGCSAVSRAPSTGSHPIHGFRERTELVTSESPARSVPGCTQSDFRTTFLGTSLKEPGPKLEVLLSPRSSVQTEDANEIEPQNEVREGRRLSWFSSQEAQLPAQLIVPIATRAENSGSDGKFHRISLFTTP